MNETHNTLRLHHCPDCGYELRGLPSEGKCPECGFAYEESMFSLRGRQSGYVPAAIFYGCMCFWAVKSLFEAEYGWGVFCVLVLVTFAIVDFSGLGAKWRRVCDWIVFCPTGVSVQQTNGPFRPITWRNYKRVTYRPHGFAITAGKRKWELRLYREPRITLYNDINRKTRVGMRKTAEDIIFRVWATEDEARHIVAAIRSLAWKGWTGAPPNPNSSREPEAQRAGFPLARE
jgi:hypothetical protein